MVCSSCAKKAEARGRRLALNAKRLNDPKRLSRLLKEAQRKGNQDKINEINKKLNGE